MISETSDCLTLGEAIRQLRKSAGEEDMTNDMSAQSGAAFYMHDAVHVIFECDNSLQGEIKAHVWMAFATTAPLAEMHQAVASREHRTVLSGIGHRKLVGFWLSMFPKIIRIIWRSRKMKTRLPYEELSSLLPVSVAAIRRQYRIAQSV